MPGLVEIATGSKGDMPTATAHEARGQSGISRESAIVSTRCHDEKHRTEANP
jgi:hypothetical protein